MTPVITLTLFTHSSYKYLPYNNGSVNFLVYFGALVILWPL